MAGRGALLMVTMIIWLSGFYGDLVAGAAPAGQKPGAKPAASPPKGAAAAPGGAARCGAPSGPCGKSMPQGSPCASDPGFCQPGFYCASCAGNGDFCKDQRSLCRPVPKGCGTAAIDPAKGWSPDPKTSCCPPNAKQAFTADYNMIFPTCANGLTCRYFTQGPWRNNPADQFAANLFATENFGNCMAIAPDCGKLGKPCCPNSYHSAYNPLPKGGFMCWGGQGFSNSSYCDSRTGKCAPNAPNCGKPGSPCCITDGGSTTNYMCMGWDAKGYMCTAPSKAKPVSMCQKCPADWRARYKQDSWEYSQCAY